MEATLQAEVLRGNFVDSCDSVLSGEDEVVENGYVTPMRKLVLVALLCGTTVSLHAQAAAVADTWGHLSALPAHSHMHVSTDAGSKTCYLIAVDESSLTCGRQDGGPKGQRVFHRADVKMVKLTRYGVSTLAGAAIGGGAGAAVGFGVTQNPQGWFNGAVRGVFAIFGGVAGAAITGPTDAFRGPVVYRRMAKP